ncbi:MAG: pyrroline-5-carboxylate reductase [Clostridia bacterium]|nr:pyrroline-5-carboxylate reductase [Clostridia bacterium]
MKKMSFIGTGVMGGAIAEAACKGNDPKDIVVTDYDKEKAKLFSQKTGACFAESNADAVRESKYILIGVKPQVGQSVLSEIGPVIKECIEKGEEKILVSIMVSVSIETIKEWLGVDVDVPIIRTLPNVAASVGKCITICTLSDLVTDEIFEEYKEILKETGTFEVLPEKKMYAGSVITGCGPAFVCMFIEALADGGVMTGLTRQQAQKFAIDTIIGAATLVEESGKHPGKLKDEVCSPGGSTIAGVVSLEKNGFRNATVQCVLDTFKRVLDMGGISEKDVI